MVFIKNLIKSWKKLEKRMNRRNMEIGKPQRIIEAVPVPETAPAPEKEKEPV